MGQRTFWRNPSVTKFGHYWIELHFPMYFTACMCCSFPPQTERVDILTHLMPFHPVTNSWKIHGITKRVACWLNVLPIALKRSVGMNSCRTRSEGKMHIALQTAAKIYRPRFFFIHEATFPRSQYVVWFFENSLWRSSINVLRSEKICFLHFLESAIINRTAFVCSWSVRASRNYSNIDYVMIDIVQRIHEAAASVTRDGRIEKSADRVSLARQQTCSITFTTERFSKMNCGMMDRMVPVRLS